MAAVVVRDLPAGLHQRLKLEAERHHRSMNREIIAILEKELAEQHLPVVSAPVFPSQPLTAAWVRDVTRSLREQR
jgi:plasmid stability protein